MFKRAGSGSVAFLLSILLAGAAFEAAAQGVAGAEKLTLKGRRGESLLRPGYAVGEYFGGSSSMGRATKAPLFSSNAAKAEFTVNAPGWAEPVTAACSGDQSRLGFSWLAFKEDELTYGCTFGGSAPDGARLGLALAEGAWRSRLQQPQRAGEIRWKDSVLRFETKRLGGLPIGGGRVMGYVITKDGKEIGGLDMNGLAPTFYLPPAASPDRDAVVVAALALFFFQDPANSSGMMGGG